MAIRTTIITATYFALAVIAGCGGDSGPKAGDRPARTTEAADAPSAEQPLLEGGERVVFIGDSLAVEAPPNYPELLPEALGGRAPEVETVNLAEPGTTASDWRPGLELFSQRLVPELGSADLVIVTLGGNDLQEGLGASDGLDGLSSGSGSSGDALGAIDSFGRRLSRIFAAIRKRAPDARIVYVGYPDYSEATAWQQAAGSLGIVALRFGLSSLLEAAGEAEPDLLIDMGPATARAGVDAMLADSEHLSAAGHELYARRLGAELTR